MSQSSFTTSLSADDREALDALHQIEFASAGADVQADPCATYKTVRPFVQKVLPWIRKIPVYGTSVATAVTLLMTIADQFCHVQ